MGDCRSDSSHQFSAAAEDNHVTQVAFCDLRRPGPNLERVTGIPALTFVEHILSILFQRKEFIDLLLPIILPDPQELDSLTSEQLREYRTFIQYQGTLDIYLRDYPVQTFGETCLESDKSVTIFINGQLVDRLESLELDVSAAPIISALLITVLHELAHFLRMTKGLGNTPPILSVPRFCDERQVDESNSGTRIVGESGYFVEEMFFGGVLTLLVPPTRSLAYEHVVGCCIESSRKWTEAEFVMKNGPPMDCYAVCDERLWLQLKKIHSSQSFTIPLVTKDTYLSETPYHNHTRLRMPCRFESLDPPCDVGSPEDQQKLVAVDRVCNFHKQPRPVKTVV
ncbi:hypothetical protein VKT23_016481 [Stygiomarasmius scandens]|uniref:Uncharacterized protein n=1 Tax=Marasmiellus scandens TaxID=2682957 RepID=A0ABR1IV78_9AGAR